jgi:phosphoribosylamine--glycine ligase
MIRVLILGSGGREHAIAWKIAQSKLLDKLFCAPGNPGTAGIAENLDIDISDFKSIKEAVLSHKIEMVVTGPEEPLVKGLGDYFNTTPELKEVMFIGPGAAGARLEGSKEFAKGFMKRHNIPTADYASFNRLTLDKGTEFLEGLTPPYVLKADGLAAGKGVLILDDLEEARKELELMLSGKFGEAGEKVVIEKFLKGTELSVFILTDGKDYLILPEAKDYKRIGENDTGLNTGGMGAVSPVPFAGKEFMHKVEERIIKPTIKGLSEENIDYKGFIFLGLINCNGDPYVIEYNVRMGDPETEAVMPRIKSDLLSHLASLHKRELHTQQLETDPRFALTIVAVSGGYPGKYNKGELITIGNNLHESTLFHSGTKADNREAKLLTNGGRVLALTTLGDTLNETAVSAYQRIKGINFRNINYRKDIGKDLMDK